MLLTALIPCADFNRVCGVRDLTVKLLMTLTADFNRVCDVCDLSVKLLMALTVQVSAVFVMFVTSP